MGIKWEIKWYNIGIGSLFLSLWISFGRAKMLYYVNSNRMIIVIARWTQPRQRKKLWKLKNALFDFHWFSFKKFYTIESINAKSHPNFVLASVTNFCYTLNSDTSFSVFASYARARGRQKLLLIVRIMDFFWYLKP